tara:strand:- start:249 stop:476 length:228 start_codon:yes stop_codon:yes gene_type:complete
MTTILGRPVAGIKYPPAVFIHSKQNKSNVACNENISMYWIYRIFLRLLELSLLMTIFIEMCSPFPRDNAEPKAVV